MQNACSVTKCLTLRLVAESQTNEDANAQVSVELRPSIPLPATASLTYSPPGLVSGPANVVFGSSGRAVIDLVPVSTALNTGDRNITVTATMAGCPSSALSFVLTDNSTAIASLRACEDCVLTPSQIAQVSQSFDFDSITPTQSESLMDALAETSDCQLLDAFDLPLGFVIPLP